MEKRPSKKEIKKYFENAETVECLCNNKEYNITNPKKEIHKEYDDYWITTEDDDVLLWCKDRRGYAKILSYKKSKFTPIAMKCVKEQFYSIKLKLEQHGIAVNEDNMHYDYLTNDYNREKVVQFTLCNNDDYEEIITYETWNEKIFLEACGIEVEKLKEEPFLITKEQLKQLRNNALHENTQLVIADLKKWFPQAFEDEKKELVVGKWYKNNSGSLFFALETESEYISGYGFIDGIWRGELKRYFSRSGAIEATNQEVEEALIKEAVMRGFKRDVCFKSLDGYDFHTIGKNIDFWFNENDSDKGYSSLRITAREEEWISNLGGKCSNPAIFKNGQWAEIIPTLTKQQAEEKLKELGVNIKIV